MPEIKNNPTVSIVIPTYNRARSIGHSIKSVLNQTYQDFEVIIVDDGSTDNTKEVVGNFNDERVRYIRHEENKGEAAARNTGIKFAGGKYIAFQDSDDEWLPEKLAKQIELFKDVSPHIGVVYTGFLKKENSEKTYIPFCWVRQKEGDIHKELLKGNFIGSPVVLIRKECFKKAGVFDERLRNLVDWEMWIRISKHYHFKCIDEPLVVAHYHSDNISDDKSSLIEALELVLEKNFDEFKKQKKLLARYWVNIGDLLISSGEIRKGRDYLIKAIKVSQFNIRLLLAAFLTFLGVYNKVISIHHRVKSVRF
jgi:glycosyltransferase involved in cell wall biosynthesis